MSTVLAKINEYGEVIVLEEVDRHAPVCEKVQETFLYKLIRQQVSFGSYTRSAKNVHRKAHLHRSDVD